MPVTLSTCNGPPRSPNTSSRCRLVSMVTRRIWVHSRGRGRGCTYAEAVVGGWVLPAVAVGGRYGRE